MTSKFSTLGWMVFFAVAAFALYLVKYQVQDIKDDVVQLEAKVQSERESIGLLNAEWSYLNHPARLEALSHQYLDLQMFSPDIVRQWNDVPMKSQAVAAVDVISEQAQ